MLLTSNLNYIFLKELCAMWMEFPKPMQVRLFTSYEFNSLILLNLLSVKAKQLLVSREKKKNIFFFTRAGPKKIFEIDCFGHLPAPFCIHFNSICVDL